MKYAVRIYGAVPDGVPLSDAIPINEIDVSLPDIVDPMVVSNVLDNLVGEIMGLGVWANVSTEVVPETEGDMVRLGIIKDEL